MLKFRVQVEVLRFDMTKQMTLKKVQFQYCFYYRR